MQYLADLAHLYAAGLPIVFAPYALALILMGVVVGIVFGCLPGLTSTMSLAVFTPFTFGMTPGQALVFLTAIYMSSVYAGAIAAILVNIPGTPSSIATALDGYPMSQRGETGRAIGLATMASFLGGLFGVLTLMLFSPLVARIAQQFGTWEYTVLALLGLTLIAYVTRGSLVRGLIGGVIGLLLASVGEDRIFAFPRFTGGVGELVGGLHVVVLMIGFFGIAEVLTQVEGGVRVSVAQRVVGMWRSARELGGHLGMILRSAIIGNLVGAVPGAGGSIASITAYGLAKRLSRRAHEYGSGSAEGIAAAESANNASVGGALVPMLTLGIPGDPMTAVLIGAVMIHGLLPGPRLFVENPDFVAAIFLGLLVSLVFMLVLGLSAARLFARLLTLPRHGILAMILLFCVVGAYAMQNSLFDVWIAAGAGVLGYLLQKVDIHPPPIILGAVLGPMFEDNLRRAILLGNGSVLPFFTRPLSLLMILIIVAVVFRPALRGLVTLGGRTGPLR